MMFLKAMTPIAGTKSLPAPFAKTEAASPRKPSGFSPCGAVLGGQFTGFLSLLRAIVT